MARTRNNVSKRDTKAKLTLRKQIVSATESHDVSLAAMEQVEQAAIAIVRQLGVEDEATSKQLGRQLSAVAARLTNHHIDRERIDTEAEQKLSAWFEAVETEASQPSVSVPNAPANEGESSLAASDTERAGLIDTWRKLSAAERDVARAEFVKIEEEEYHRLLFGSLKTKPTVERLQKWLRANAERRFSDEEIVVIAKALQHFRKTLRIELQIRHPETGDWVPCRIGSKMYADRGYTKFVVTEPTKRQRELAQLATLPHLTALSL